MELRHLRYFLAVAEALSFNKAAAKLHIAQPALSRQVQDLEDEIGVDLFKRSPQGVTLTAEGKLFAEEARDALKRMDESVEKVRALARGQYGELHVGYAPSPTVEILPPALAAFQKKFPHVNILLHDVSKREAVEGLHSGELHLALLPEVPNFGSEGIEFEALRTYPICVAVASNHPFTRLKTVPLQKLATEPLIGFTRRDYPEYRPLIEHLFRPLGIKPRITVECDSSSSLITAVETGRGIALTMSALKIVSGKRLIYRPLIGTNEVIPVGIARVKGGDLTPAGEKFCEFLRKSSQLQSK